MYSRMVVDHFDGSYWLIIESCCVSDIVLHLHQSTTNKLCSRNFCEKNMMWHISSRPTGPHHVSRFHAFTCFHLLSVFMSRTSTKTMCRIHRPILTFVVVTCRNPFAEGAPRDCSTMKSKTSRTFWPHAKTHLNETSGGWLPDFVNFRSQDLFNGCHLVIWHVAKCKIRKNTILIGKYRQLSEKIHRYPAIWVIFIYARC